MADINNKIIVDVEDNASGKLENIQGSLNGLNQNQTKVIQSTKNLTKETDNLNKGLLNNGGAMGLLSAATGGLAMDFKDAVEAIELTGISLKGLRGAIIATGIGALAIAVLELVSNWDKWKGVIDGSTAAMQKLNGQLAINNTKREESNAITNASISNLSEELRLLQAQGAAKDVILAKENEISAAKTRQAQIDVENYRTQLAQIDAVIAKDTELNSLEKELFDLRNGATTQNLVDLVDLIAAKEGEIALYKSQNDLFKQRKELTDKISAAQIALNTSINDPKVRAAQAESDRRAIIKTKELEKQKKLQDFINSSFQKGEAAAKTLRDINNSLIGLTLNDLTPTYSKFKNLTDAFNTTADASERLIIEIKSLKDKVNTPEDQKKLKSLQDQLKLVSQNYNLVRKSLRDLVNDNPDSFTDTWDKQTYELNMELSAMSSNLDILTNSIMQYEKAGFGEYQSITSDNIYRINSQLQNQLEITRAQYDIDKKSRTEKLKSLEKEEQDLSLRQKSLESINVANKNVGDYIKQLRKDLMNDNLDIKLENMLNLPELEKVDPILKEYAKQYFDLEDKKRDFSRQTKELLQQDVVATNQLEIDLHKLKVDALIEQERMAYEVRYSAQEDYYNSVQTLASNTFGFMSQLQDETIIKDKDVRNVLLVAQKGAEIAQVVIGTARENSKLKMQAGEYAGNAALYGSLSAALAPVNPIAAASYGAAAGAYGAAATKSAAQIPINWGIAGASIASILATTLTSWNRSGDSSGSSAGGGGGSSAPQFNIVGTNNNNQLAAAIASQQNQPINAYVVGSHITTQQALDRNRINTATFI